MKTTRRQVLQSAVGAVAASGGLRIARAQGYPAKPVRLVVGLAAGGATDIVSRLMGQWLSERLGQQFVVENRTGAGGNVASDAVAHASADGYTLLGANAANAINATLYEKLNFNFIRDIAPVASFVRSPLIVVVHPSFPATTIPELIAHAKANPGKISMASSGVGTPLHVAGELFKMMTGVDMVHVPYKGAAPALTDLLGAQVQLMFSDMTAVEYIRDGRLRGLAVTTATRSPVLPGLPVVGDFVPGYEASVWIGMGAPAKTPAEIVDKLNNETNAGLAGAKMQARLADLGYTPFATSPAEFSAFIAAEVEKWRQVIRTFNIRPE
jgi:tripartite-type tricarboxylate transporter receptor subunit TctC